MAGSEKYPIGIQTFSAIREDGYIYVDKTRMIYNLVHNSKYVFLSRPRRFGKSLLLSTIEAYFQGRKDLFEGLAIAEMESSWESYPVLYFSFTSVAGGDWKELNEYIHSRIASYSAEYGVPYDKSILSVGTAFGQLLEQIFKKTGKKVVVLVDEYDKTLNAVLHDSEALERNSMALQPFFAQLKDQDRYLRFAMLTGVARFRHLTIFSGANNLEDISMQREYATLCGVTLEEMLHYFPEGLDRLCKEYDSPRDEMVNTLKTKYDGYRFTAATEYVFNPFSILNVMKTRELDNFWLQSGTSRVFLHYLKNTRFNLLDLQSMWVDKIKLADIFSKNNPIPLLFQTGYLTIRDVRGQRIRLGIPNGEVQEALVDQLIPAYMGIDEDAVSELLYDFQEPIKSGDVDALMKLLQSFLAKIPYQLFNGDIERQEATFHMLVYELFLMIGVKCQSEISIAGGRIDMVVETLRLVYVMEFKMNRPAEEALAQINDNDYALPWQADGRKVIKIGVAFSSEKRNITSWTTQR